MPKKKTPTRHELKARALADLASYGRGDDYRQDPVLNEFLKCKHMQAASQLLGKALFGRDPYDTDEAIHPPACSVFPI